MSNTIPKYVPGYVEVGGFVYRVLRQDETHILAWESGGEVFKKISLDELRPATSEDPQVCTCVYAGDLDWINLNDGTFGEFQSSLPTE